MADERVIRSLNSKHEIRNKLKTRIFKFQKQNSEVAHGR
jgi:hypothetical protein